MKVREIVLPDEVDERLKQWARYFKDRVKYERCKSLEGRFNPFAPGAWDAGWGDNEAPPEAPPPPLHLNVVLQTHDAIQELDKAQKWSITFGYCYPGIERWQVLKYLRKYTGRRFTWKEYLNTLEMGRIRVWAGILNKKSTCLP